MNPSIHLLKTRQPLRQIARAALLTTLIASQAFGIGDFNPRPPLPNLIGLGQGTSTIGFQLSPGQIETIRRRVEFMPDFSPAARASRPTLVLLIHGRTDGLDVRDFVNRA
ncbi:MAG: hypothetical protein ACK5TH_11455, partial [Prosthecobacter sp.]